MTHPDPPTANPPTPGSGTGGPPVADAAAAGFGTAGPSIADPAAGACPVPRAETERVLLGHGSGGQLTAELLNDLLLPALGPSATTGPRQDAAVLPLGPLDLVMSTDSFVVSPLFFPGGDIGALAVHGTINDVAMMGAEPLALSIAYVIEEGFPLADLRRVAESVGRAATSAGVPVVTGDTKVVDRGAADKLFITTTGIGRRLPGATPSADGGRPGDAVLLSGPIGLHGTTVLNARMDLGIEADLASDTRPLHTLVRTMIETAGPAVHTLRDPTRGGLAAALGELATDSAICVELDEPNLPVPPPVAATCELLGLDPLHVANEGCLVAFVAPTHTDTLLTAMHPLAPDSRQIGTLTKSPPGRVQMRTLLGAHRIIDIPLGEQLPRIC